MVISFSLHALTMFGYTNKIHPKDDTFKLKMYIDGFEAGFVHYHLKKGGVHIHFIWLDEEFRGLRLSRELYSKILSLHSGHVLTESSEYTKEGLRARRAFEREFLQNPMNQGGAA